MMRFETTLLLDDQPIDLEVSYVGDGFASAVMLGDVIVAGTTARYDCTVSEWRQLVEKCRRHLADRLTNAPDPLRNPARKGCGSCADFVRNGTRYGGLCAGEGSPFGGMLISALKPGCIRHRYEAAEA